MITAVRTAQLIEHVTFPPAACATLSSFAIVTESQYLPTLSDANEFNVQEEASSFS